MKSVKIYELIDSSDRFIDREIEINGWLRKKRISSNVGFFEVSDGSSFNNIQVVFNKDIANFDELDKATLSSTLRIKGTLKKSEGSQNVEILASEVEILFVSDRDYPLQNKRHTLEFMRTILHIRPRANTYKAVFKVRSLISHALHMFFSENNFVYIHTPLITSSDCEGAGEMFRVTTIDVDKPERDDKGNIDYTSDFFSKEVFLTVSGQTALEPFAHAFDKVYTFGPTFRAENSNTTRHASEFWMVEPEMAFCDLEQNMEVMEKMIKYVVNYCLENAKDELKFFNSFFDKTLLKRLNELVSSDFAKVSYTEAIDILEKSNEKFEYDVFWGMDIQTEHEKYLAGKHFGKPVFITDYPKDIKSFYMKQNDDGKTVRAVDLIVPYVGELIGGSQREDDYDKLLSAIKEKNLKQEDYQWYLDLRRFGSSVHSGFGLGLERAVLYITGMANIRDVIAYPRTPRNADM